MEELERAIQREWDRVAEALDARKTRNLAEGLKKLLAREPGLTSLKSLSLSECHVLQCIAQEPQIYSIDIARRLSLTRSAVSKIIAKLVQKGLLVPSPEKVDGKILRFRLTPLGKKVNGIHEGYHQKIHQEFAQRLRAYTEEEQRVILAFLQGL